MEDTYRDILEENLSGYWFWDIAGNKEFVSPAFLSFLGYNPGQEKSPSSLQEVIVEEDLSIFSKNFIQYIDSKGSVPLQHEIRVKHRSGMHLWVLNIAKATEWDVEGRPVKINGFCIDISRQKLLEDELKIHEQRYKDAFNNSPIGQAWVSPEGHWLKVNKKLCDIVGYTIDELLNTTFQEITYPDDLYSDLKYVSDLLRGEIEWYQMDKRYYHKSGKIVWVKLAVSLVRNKQGEPLYFVSQIQDVSEQKEAEKKLHDANKELSTLFDSITNFLIIATDRNGLIKNYNRGAEIMLGYTAEEMVNKQTPAIFHIKSEVEERAKELTELYGRPIKGFDVLVIKAKEGGYEEGDWTFVTKDGRHIPVHLVITPVYDDNGDVTGFLGIAADISEAKKAQQALRDSEAKYRRIFESVQDVFYQTDRDGIITDISPSIEKYSGYKRSYIIGKPSAEFYYYVEDREKLAQALLEKGYVNDFELRMKTFDDKLVYVSVNAHFVVNKDGNITGTEGSMRDISERKLKEQQLTNTLDIISEQNKRLFNFAHIVSHNLRSHSGNLELLLVLYNEAKNDEEKTVLLQYLKTVSVQLSETISHLNEVVSIQTNISHQRKKINLHDYVENARSTLFGEISMHDIVFENNVPADIFVYYNEAYLESILLNFLSNAIKYRNHERQAFVKANAYYEQENLILEIEDNGVGIDLDKYGDKIFGMYKTFHGNEDAKGIGLFIAKNQIEAMGGRVDVESQVGIGTKFKIYLSQ